MSIGSNLRKLRDAHGLSQSDLARVAEVTDQAVSAWETNVRVPRMKYMQRIADYFNVPVSVIIEEGSVEPVVAEIIELQEKYMDQFTHTRSNEKGEKEFIEVKYYENNVIAFVNGDRCDFTKVFFKLDDNGKKNVLLDMLKRYC